MTVLPPRWSPPGWLPPVGRISPIPLGATLLTTAALLVVPTLLLLRLPRPQAIGLEKLMANVSLLQSFAAHPDRPAPEVWRTRFGPAAGDRLWRTQTRTWWQFWDGHADGQPYLALSFRGLPESLLRSAAVPPLRVGDLAIFPPDPRSRDLLRARLQPQVRRSSGLRLRCLSRMERDQAVFWRPAGLGVLLGPLAPFLQDLQEGCLSLTITGDGLQWSGEAASVEGMVLQAPGSGGAESRPLVVNPPASDVLLEVRGGSLEQLLSGLLARELIRQPLAERYGLGPEQISLLRQTPFRLALRPRSDGVFQASIDLTVAVGSKTNSWEEGLAGLAKSLDKEGLRPTAGEGKGMARWQRKDGVVVGGWMWHKGNTRITLFLGPAPSQLAQSPALSGELFPAGQRAGMVLFARPRELEARGLLPPDLPEVVRRSNALWVAAEPSSGFANAAFVSQLQGALLLRP